MHRGRIDILREVIVAMTGSLGTDTTASLLVEFVQMGTLDIAHVADGDDHWIIGIEVLGIELVVEGDNLGTTLVAILLLHLLQLILHHLLTTLRIVENLLQVSNKLHQVVIFLMQLVNTQAGELTQAHINDSFRLQLVQVKTSLQITLGITGCLAVPDDMNNLVDVVDGDNQTL